MATVVEDDWIIDTETGEVIGIEGWQIEGAVESEKELWTLQKRMLETDAKISAERMMMKSIIANCEQRIKRLESRQKWLDLRYGVSAAATAKSLLLKGSKTYTSPYGKIAFRTTKDKIVIDDQEAFSKWASQHCPEALKQSVLVSKLPKEQVDRWLNIEEFMPKGIHIEPGGESVTFVGITKDEPNERPEQD
jgi:uncharacterized protein YuzE